MDELSKNQLFSKSLQAAAVATARALPGEAVENHASCDRLAKIDLLRQQVSNGTYQPDVSGLSKRLIDEHLSD